MSFKSSRGRDLGKEVATWQSNNIGQGIGGAGSGGAAGPGIVATGGTKTTSNGYAYHHFTSPGTFAVSAITPNPFSYEFISVLAVGGGGGGSGNMPTGPQPTSWGAGGVGGGGRGGAQSTPQLIGTPGTDGTGGGGGGIADSFGGLDNAPAGDGGSGCVIVFYKI